MLRAAVAAAERRRTSTMTPVFPTLTGGVVHTRISAMQQTLANGASVPTATDYSGNARTITASGTVTYSTTGFNGKPTFVFSGGPYFDVAAFTAISATSAIHVWAMVQPANFTGGAKGILANTSGNTIWLGVSTTPNFLFQRGSSDIVGGTPTTSPQRVRAFYPASGAATAALYVNGTQVAGPAGAGSGAPTTFRIANNPSSNVFTGNIAELIVCTGALTGTDISNIDTYLTQTWGI